MLSVVGANDDNGGERGEIAGINVGSKFHRNRERITSLRDIKPIIFREGEFDEEIVK